MRLFVASASRIRSKITIVPLIEYPTIVRISGVKRYTGARVNAPDLRAGAALVIAGLAAEGITVVDDIYYIQRGYEALEEKLTKIGDKNCQGRG